MAILLLLSLASAQINFSTSWGKRAFQHQHEMIHSNGDQQVATGQSGEALHPFQTVFKSLQLIHQLAEVSNIPAARWFPTVLIKRSLKTGRNDPSGQIRPGSPASRSINRKPLRIPSSSEHKTYTQAITLLKKDERKKEKEKLIFIIFAVISARLYMMSLGSRVLKLAAHNSK